MVMIVRTAGDPIVIIAQRVALSMISKERMCFLQVLTKEGSLSGLKLKRATALHIGDQAYTHHQDDLQLLGLINKSDGEWTLAAQWSEIFTDSANC